MHFNKKDKHLILTKMHNGYIKEVFKELEFDDEIKKTMQIGFYALKKVMKQSKNSLYFFYLI